MVVYLMKLECLGLVCRQNKFKECLLFYSNIWKIGKYLIVFINTIIYSELRVCSYVCNYILFLIYIYMKGGVVSYNY